MEKTPLSASPQGIPPGASEVLRRLEAAGYRAVCVGGCVRDTLLGRRPKDWDVACSARPEEVLALFGPQGRPTGLQHGTVTLTVAGEAVEVTAFRQDGHYSDRRRPDAVYYTQDLEKDLARRDFTVNAMALDLRGVLSDPFGGRGDLAAGRLRCVGTPEDRFEEDPLRILRGLRLASALSFTVDPGTRRAMTACRAGLQTVAAERIWQELTGLLTGAAAAQVLRQCPEIVGVFWPEIEETVGFDQRNRHHCYDVWEHLLHTLAQTEAVLPLRCAALLHDVGKPRCFSLDRQGVGHFYGHSAASREMTRTMLRRLRCPKALEDTAVTLVDWHDRDIPRTEPGIKRALNRLGRERLELLLKLKRADNLAQAPAFHARQEDIALAEALLAQVLEKEACFSLRDLALKGGDLMALGYRGAEIGSALGHLLEQVMDGHLPNERWALLAAAQRDASGRSGERDAPRPGREGEEAAPAKERPRPPSP